MEKATEKSLYDLFIDFLKAFDSVTWPCIAAVLKFYSVLANAIISLYYGANAEICINDGFFRTYSSIIWCNTRW